MKSIVQPEFIVISRSVNLALDNISKFNSKFSVNYQSELVAVWSELVKSDGTGILENSIQHSWGCKCCTPDEDYLRTKRKYYKRKTQRPYTFKHKERN